MPLPTRLSTLALCLGLLTLPGCIGALNDLDFDLRPDGINSRPVGETAPRPEPDARGLITYESYQVVVARRGDTVADVAGRIGMEAAELARFNGRGTTDVLREDEILALPRRIGPGGTDIAAIARGAIDEAEAATPGAGTGVAVQPGREPIRHQVDRGETAYSVARLYGVSVRALAEWNGLGPDLAVREGQYLIIPIIIEDGAAEIVATPIDPGETRAPLPPSAATPLPDPIQEARVPDASTPSPIAPPAAPAAPAASSSGFVQPVDGPVLRPFGNGNEGIDFAAPPGTPVRAAAAGQVAAITQNTDQIPILVLRHDGGLLSVYANIQNISVARGDSVSAGQTVAEVGPGDPSFLHFEVRRGMAAVDPTEVLP